MAQTRIKICGMTRAEDAAKAAELGVDAVGLNFVGGPRMIELETGTDIAFALRAVPIAPVVVALCGSPSGQMRECISAGEILHEMQVGAFQVYGRSQALLLNDEDSLPYWYVVSVSSRASIVDHIAQLSIDDLQPQAILFDTASAEKLGGTGTSFNWHWIAEARAAGELNGLPPIILAGGLNADNVAEAIRIAQPYAVDVSSGVEVAGKPGIKDPIKMRDFIQAVRGA